MSSSNDESQAQQAQIMELQRVLLATRGELLKAQIVAATRQDVIRLLGYIANREIPDLSEFLPREPEARTALALEMRELVTDLRSRAQRYEDLAGSLHCLEST